MVAVAQLVELQFVVLAVAGSSPVGHPGPSGHNVVGRSWCSLHCRLATAPLAQWQSNGLLIRRFWVRLPGGAHTTPGQRHNSRLPLQSINRTVGHLWRDRLADRLVMVSVPWLSMAIASSRRWTARARITCAPAPDQRGESARSHRRQTSRRAAGGADTAIHHRRR